MSLFVSGALAAGYAVAALFFARFWRDTHDRLFAWFAVAFALLAVQRAALSMLTGIGGGTAAIYLLRLLAFVIIIVAVVDKNRAAGAGR